MPSAATPLPPALFQVLLDGARDLQSGQPGRADAAADRVLSVLPNQPDALHIKGMAAYSQGRHAQALVWVDRALAVARSDSVLSHRGRILQDLGRLDEAIASFQSALKLSPRSAEIWCNLGAAQMHGAISASQDPTVATKRRIDLLDTALVSLQKAVECDPKSVEALNVLGLYWYERQNHQAAERAFRDALAIQPDFPPALNNLGNACRAQKRLDEALENYRRAVAVQPGFVDALDNLAQLLRQANRSAEGAEVAQAAFARQPSVERHIQAALSLPAIADSSAQILADRSRFDTALDRLLLEAERVAVVTPALFCASTFYLAYHGLNNVALRSKLSRFYEHIHPGLRYVAPHVQRARNPAQALRIGFFSAFVHDHAVTHCFSATINRLSADPRCAVHLITTSPVPNRGDATSPYKDFQGAVVNVAQGYMGARNALAELELDVLVYQDIGMEFLSYFLAHGRLAQTQCVLGGHPETTGIAAVDYFLSTAGCEPHDGDSHYVEKLVRLPHGVAQYRKPPIPQRQKSRRELGLPDNGHVYLCPMMLQKLHPDFDGAIDAILAADPDGHVVLFEHQWLPWGEALRQRMQESVADAHRDRVLFLPWIDDKADFFALHVHASVVIDPFHFGIGSTAITAVAAHTPFVTWPGEFMRGRGGLDYCQVLGLDECIADDWPDYVAKAVAIATQPDLRRHLGSKIAANEHRFFDNQQVSAELAEFFIGLAPGAGVTSDALVTGASTHAAAVA